MHVIIKLASNSGKIDLKIKSTSCSCYEKFKEEKKSNAAKQEKMKKQRLLKGACDVLHIICKDGASDAHCRCNGETQFVPEISYAQS